MREEIRFEGISVVRDGRPILTDVSFTVRAGERTALVGPNGGGKTTLVRVLLGLLPPASGAVRFLGADGVATKRPRIGYLSQRSTLSPDAPVSGLDLVRLALEPEAGFGTG